MKIGVDIRPLQRETRFRGIGKYLEHLLAAMAQAPERHHYVFFAESGSPLPDALLQRFESWELRLVAPRRLSRVRFVRAFVPPGRRIDLGQREVDVMFVADAMLGLPGGAPVVAVFYDVIPLLFPDDERIRNSKGLRKAKRRLAAEVHERRYRRFLSSFARAARILAISERSRQDLHTYLPASRSIPTDVVHLGAPPSPAVPSAPAPLPDPLVLGQRYLLYVGGIDRRKNIVGLARAFVEVKPSHPELKLAVVGKEFELTDDLHHLGWFAALGDLEDGSDVVQLGFVDDATLASLYLHAAAFVFPSQYEGFGLPIVEAMRHGCPVVAYGNSSIPEVAGNAAVLAVDHASFVDGIRAVLDDDALRRELSARGRAQAARFTWERTASETLRALERCAGPSAAGRPR